jgi:hypothetical protein
MNGELSDNKTAERTTESALECLESMAAALNRLFSILFSCEGLAVKDISISVRRNPTLAKYAQDEKHPSVPSEIATIEVSVKLGLNRPFDPDMLADMAKSIKKAGIKASFTAGELNIKMNLADMPLA